MSTRIIAETSKQRNRRLLLAAFDRGVTVQSHWGGRYTVTSGTQAGKLHEVTLYMDSDFNRHEECSCDWATKRGAVITFNAGTAQQHTNHVPPCSHILIARFARLSADARALLLESDPELAAAYDGCGQLAEVA
jgi:hypothetical protein